MGEKYRLPFLHARGLHWRAMDFFTVDVATLRWVVCIVVAAVVLGAEWAVPLRTPIQSKLEHVSTDLIIFGAGSACVGFDRCSSQPLPLAQRPDNG